MCYKIKVENMFIKENACDFALVMKLERDTLNLKAKLS